MIKAALAWREKARLVKRRGLALRAAVLLLPLLYFIDVWLLGSLAALLHDIYFILKPAGVFGAFLVKHNPAAPYIVSHPLVTGAAWLTKSNGELIHPGVRGLWLFLNALLPAALAVALVKRKARNDSRFAHGLRITDNPVYGTSHWASARDIRGMCELGPPGASEFPGGIFLGVLGGKMVRLIPGKAPAGTPPLAGHAAVFGGTGSGKSYSFVMNNIICATAEGQSFIVTDPKAELAETTANWLTSLGYEVRVFNLNNPAHSHSWNPLAECGSDAEISEMAACFIHNATGREESGYFVAKEIQLFEALSGLLLGAFPPEQQHLRAVISLAARSQEELEGLFKRAFESGGISAAIYEKWRGCSAVNLDHAVSGLTAKLKVLAIESIAGLLSKQEIDLAGPGRRKTALFCVLPVRGESGVLKPVLATFYLFLFKRLYDLADNNGRRLPTPVRVLLDEFANIGRIPGFPEIISTARSLGIQIQFILQGRSQLDEVYSPQEAKTILANCPVLLLLGVAPGDLETAETFSKILGKAAVRGYFESEDVTLPIASRFQLTRRTKQALQRSLMTADEITRMGPLDSLAVVQWCYPLYLQKAGWVTLPQGAAIRARGTVALKELLPERRFTLTLPSFNEIPKERGTGVVSASQSTW